MTDVLAAYACATMSDLMTRQGPVRAVTTAFLHGETGRRQREQRERKMHADAPCETVARAGLPSYGARASGDYACGGTRLVGQIAELCLDLLVQLLVDLGDLLLAVDGVLELCSNGRTCPSQLSPNLQARSNEKATPR